MLIKLNDNHYIDGDLITELVITEDDNTHNLTLTVSVITEHNTVREITVLRSDNYYQVKNRIESIYNQVNEQE